MFGYILTNAETLPKERQERFRAFYCGLCRTLKKRYGPVGSFALSFDMTFLALLLNALYEPGESAGDERCLPHPLRRHAFVDTPVLDYAADMNLALAYHKCQDNWIDDRSVISAAEAKLLGRAYRKVVERHPEKCAAIQDWLEEIHRIEAAGIEEIDPPVNATGHMLGELFVYREGDIWSDALRGVGNGLGRFIYMMDAYDDLREDIRRRRYNPLKRYCEREDYEEMCRSALMMMVADATQEFELLPIVQDADILRNILYSGIWSKYSLLQNRRETKKEEHEHAGSV